MKYLNNHNFKQISIAVKNYKCNPQTYGYNLQLKNTINKLFKHCMVRMYNCTHFGAGNFTKHC